MVDRILEPSNARFERLSMFRKEPLKGEKLIFGTENLFGYF
jgi:hypothetical protein